VGGIQEEMDFSVTNGVCQVNGYWNVSVACIETIFPTFYPTLVPSAIPTSAPSTPTEIPTSCPTSLPSSAPTFMPTFGNEETSILCDLIASTNLAELSSAGIIRGWTCDEANYPITTSHRTVCEDSWTGLGCDESFHIAEISLTGIGLNGLLPQSLGNLSSLTLLNVSLNSLTGPFPAGFGQAQNVVTLDIHGNRFGSSLRRELAVAEADPMMVSLMEAVSKLQKLTYLDISDNGFSGPLADQVCDIDSLQTIIVQQTTVVVEGVANNISCIPWCLLTKVSSIVIPLSVPICVGTDSPTVPPTQANGARAAAAAGALSTQGIGLLVGGVFFLCLILIVLYFCFGRKNDKDEKDNQLDVIPLDKDASRVNIASLRSHYDSDSAESRSIRSSGSFISMISMKSSETPPRTQTNKPFALVVSDQDRSVVTEEANLADFTDPFNRFLQQQSSSGSFEKVDIPVEDLLDGVVESDNDNSESDHEGRSAIVAKDEHLIAYEDVYQGKEDVDTMSFTGSEISELSGNSLQTGDVSLRMSRQAESKDDSSKEEIRSGRAAPPPRLVYKPRNGSGEETSPATSPVMALTSKKPRQPNLRLESERFNL